MDLKKEILKCIVKNSALSEIIKMFYDSPLIRVDELFSKVVESKKNIESLNFLISNGFLVRTGNYFKAVNNTWKIAYALKSYEVAKVYLDKFFVDELLMQGNVLDLGCGGGAYAAYLNSSKKDSIIGVDIDEDLIYIAKMKNKNCQFLIADAHALPFRSGTFNFVLSLLLLPYVNEEKVIHEISRVLLKEGIIFLRLHGPGLYLENAFKRRRAGILSRMINLFIMFNTFIYYLTGKKIINNTFQSKSKVQKLLKDHGFLILKVNDESKYAGLPTLWNVMAKKVVSSK
jgi:ubiquinone/menaquinone biosynthesis C-methylase UbiE